MVQIPLNRVGRQVSHVKWQTGQSLVLAVAKSFWHGRRGTTSIEYAVLAGVVAMGVLVGLNSLQAAVEGGGGGGGGTFKAYQEAMQKNR